MNVGLTVWVAFPGGLRTGEGRTMRWCSRNVTGIFGSSVIFFKTLKYFFLELETRLPVLYCRALKDSYGL
jgi:hypothetical protein